jgi:RimJ/RimL family protein N-acetyltransferase
MSPILLTPRLALREMTRDDLDFVAAMLGDPEVMRYYPSVCSRAEAAAWIDRQRERYARVGYGRWLVVDRFTEEPFGQVGVVPQRVEGTSEPQPEVGYIIHRPYWRRGYATEAATATRDHAFGALGRTRVISLVRPENLPSQGVARKLGMTPESRPVSHGGFPHLVFAVERRDE